MVNEIGNVNRFFLFFCAGRSAQESFDIVIWKDAAAAARWLLEKFGIIVEVRQCLAMQ